MRSNDNVMLLTTISAGANDFLALKYTCFVDCLCIYSQSFNNFYEKYFRYKL